MAYDSYHSSCKATLCLISDSSVTHKIPFNLAFPDIQQALGRLSRGKIYI
jgi:hypothetical protein